MTAKPATERMAAMRKRRRESGLRPIEVWAHPDDQPAIKDFAAGLAKKRQKPAPPRA